jgi:hypothetical protein
MTIMTYSEILTTMCDAFDGYIAPKTIKRSNTNIIYLILKAVAKGYETINNVCVLLSYKFDPANCTAEDLSSVALIAGTERLSGKGSSLLITASNGNTVSAVTLSAGTYTYAFSSDFSFVFVLSQNVQIAAGGTHTEAALCSVTGACLVTSQTSITVTAVDSNGNTLTLSLDITFSCGDNTSMQGYAAETDAEFRKRILTDKDRVSVVNELQTALRNISSIYDALVTFNATGSPVTVGGYTIPAYYMLIVLSGTVTAEVAEVVAAYGIFPTVLVSGGVTMYYQSDCLAGSGYPVNYVMFGSTEYSIKLDFVYSESVYALGDIESAITAALAVYKNPVTRTAYITEKLFYDVVASLNLSSVVLRNVTLYDSSGTEIPYLEIDRTHIGKLTSVVYSGTAV